MMEERGVEVDHSTLNPWVVKYTLVGDDLQREAAALVAHGRGFMMPKWRTEPYRRVT
jgi:hypothetical protein